MQPSWLDSPPPEGRSQRWPEKAGSAEALEEWVAPPVPGQLAWKFVPDDDPPTSRMRAIFLVKDEELRIRGSARLHSCETSRLRGS